MEARDGVFTLCLFFSLVWLFKTPLILYNRYMYKKYKLKKVGIISSFVAINYIYIICVCSQNFCNLVWWDSCYLATQYIANIDFLQDWGGKQAYGILPTWWRAVTVAYRRLEQKHRNSVSDLIRDPPQDHWLPFLQ